MRIEILDRAIEDLINGFQFYEAQQGGLGSYFLLNLLADIESLLLYRGIHEKVYRDYYRLLSRRFPFAVFYTVQKSGVLVHAVLDCRRDPAWIKGRLD
ncbi:MAG: type II toxin-antitoxin system RelE/ParE family toxin [Pyrinomonadaceae bacterium]